VDIASLGIRVTSQGAKEAADDLDRLEKSGARAEVSVKKLAPAARTSSEALALFSKIDPASGKLDALDKLEGELNKLSRAGKVGAADFAAMTAKLASSRAAILGTGAATAEAATLVEKFTNNTRLMSEASTIASDVVSGQFGRIRRSAAAMANASGVFRLAFSGVGAAVLGVAAAAGALAIAYEQGSSEQEDFNKALILTGSYAGTTAQRMQAMAANLDTLAGVTQHRAAAALTAVAGSGKFTADQFELVAGAALKWQDATGQAVEDTIKQFERLGKDPVNAILDLNDAQHFLTQETLKQIESLVDQGRQADAARVAMEAYAASLNSKAGQITQNLGYVETAWKIVKDTASEAWDAMLGIGRTQTIAQQISSVQEQIARAQARGFGTSQLEAQLKSLQAKPDFSNVTSGSAGSVNSDVVRARQDAEKEFGRIVESHLSRQKKLEEEIAHIRDVGRKAGLDSAKIEEQVSAARAAAVVSTAHGGRIRTPRAASVPDFTKGMAEELARQADAEDRATQSFLDMQAALDGPLAEAEREHVKRVEQLNQLAAQSPTAAAGLKDALDAEARAHEKNVQAIKAELDPLGTLLDDMQFELDTIGKSNAERAVMIELRRNHIDVMSQEAQAALATASAFDAEAKAKQTSIDLMDDFRRGASSALSDFVTGAKSAKDALTDFFDSLAEQITKAISDQWIQKLFGQEGSSGSGTSGGGWLSSIFGALFGGGGGGEQIYAKGGAFEGGVQKFAYGGVVSSPTNFGMAGGRLGLMGEAGPEAILPLHRGPDGKLGVRMEASNGSARSGPTVVNQTVVVQGRIDSRTPAQFAQATAREQNRASVRNR
jgi:phage-related minor tail protein